VKHLRPILVSTAATAPVAACILALGNGELRDVGFLFFSLVIATIFMFPVLFVANVVIGFPLSVLLDRFGATSRGAYITTGALVAICAVAFWTLYQSLFLPFGPFSVSLADSINALGVRRVVFSHIRVAALGAFCGGVSANFYWSALRRRAA
jgi:hypothetical protein